MGAKRIAITVQESSGLESRFDGRFGRAPYFLIVEETSSGPKVVECIQNGAVDDAHGAGTGAAGLMARHGVTDVITGRFGPKAYQALEALTIRMWTAPEIETAIGVLGLLRDGKLNEMKIKVFE